MVAIPDRIQNARAALPRVRWGALSIGLSIALLPACAPVDGPNASPFKGGDPEVEAAQFDTWLEDELTRSAWIEGLPRCPEHMADLDPRVWREVTRANRRLHPGGAYAVRSKPLQGGHGNQCVFDAEGRLMLTAPAAGTADAATPVGLASYLRHYVHDILPYKVALRLGRLPDYLRVRPIWH